MSTTTPFDILFRNFFDRDLGYLPAAQTKIAHPLDIYYNDEGLFFEVACTGLSKKDIDINIEGQEISISYQKPKKEENLPGGYIYNGISKKSFRFGYKIVSKYNLSQASADMENGLLKIQVPIAEESKPQVLKIK
jgi:HSP20 family molecular chaperone IbpA